MTFDETFGNSPQANGLSAPPVHFDRQRYLFAHTLDSTLAAEKSLDGREDTQIDRLSST
jgi:hypothetical protein